MLAWCTANLYRMAWGKQKGDASFIELWKLLQSFAKVLRLRNMTQTHQNIRGVRVNMAGNFQICSGLPCHPVRPVLTWKNKARISKSKTTEIKLWRHWTTAPSRSLGSKGHSNRKLPVGRSYKPWVGKSCGTGRTLPWIIQQDPKQRLAGCSRPHVS